MSEEVIESGEEQPSQSKKGWQNNKHLINRNGRPKGSRNKSSLLKAQLQIDNSTEYAAEFLDALMRNDKGALGLKSSEDVPLTIRHKAAIDILNKSIANEKDKDPNSEKDPLDNTGSTPIFSTRAVATLKKV